MDRTIYVKIDVPNQNEDYVKVVLDRTSWELEKRIAYKWGVQVAARPIQDVIFIVFEKPCAHISNKAITDMIQTIVDEIAAVYKQVDRIRPILL